MNIKGTVISSFANFLLGRDIFSRLRGTVERQADTELTGPQKRAAVFEELKTIGLELENWAINLGIELAVAWMMTQASKK